MITLITGTPGAGKTALAVSMLLEEQGGRPLFISGIPELKIEHQPVPPVDEWTVEVPTPEDPNFKKPVFTFPPQSIIVVDEAQNIYRPRSTSSKVPPYVAAFETHRHTGVDFWLITQHPGLIDSNIRKLVGRHVHIRQTILGRYLYEWPEIGDPDTKSSRDLSASRRYKPPKKVFGLYKSATTHLKQSFRIPMAVYIFGIGILVLLLLGYQIYNRIQEVKNASSPFGPASAPGAPGAPGSPGAPAVPVQHVKLSPAQYAETFTPRLAALTHTAPAYDDLTKVSRVPVPAGCLSTKTRCQCYTQDATPYNADESLCRQIVNGGIFLAFDPDPARSNAKPHGDRAGAASAASAPAPLAANVLPSTPYELPSQ